MEQIRLVFVVLVLLLSVFAMLVVPLPIKVHGSKLNVKDYNLQETKALVINKKPLNTEGNNAYKSTLDDPETTMSESNPGLRLFPDRQSDGQSDGQSDRQSDTQEGPSPKPAFISFFQDPQERGKQGRQGDAGIDGATKNGTAGDSEVGADDYKEDYDGPLEKKGDDPDPRSNNVKIGGGTPRTIPIEKTVSIPKFKTDYLGNWVYNPWGVTYGQMFRDTRFIGLKYSDLTIHYDKHSKLYDPQIVPTKKVCRRESTVYNVPYVKQYLRQPFYLYAFKMMHVFPDLRREIYEKGKSEECHTPEQINWRIFNECQMMRHMRMEYLVPYYPLIQTQSHWDYEAYYHHMWPMDTDPFFDLGSEDYTPRWPNTYPPPWYKI